MYEESSRQDQQANMPPLAQPTPSDDGVDLILIRRMLSLTPAERLEVLQQTVSSILKLRGGRDYKARELKAGGL